jgi:putative oxidoreductase
MTPAYIYKKAGVMFRSLLSPNPLHYKTGMASIRIIVGLLMVYHGWEVFDRATMEPYFEWEQLKTLPLPAEVMAYAGKSLELVTGICLTIGFLTRVAAIFLTINMLFITFYIGLCSYRRDLLFYRSREMGPGPRRF